MLGKTAWIKRLSIQLAKQDSFLNLPPKVFLQLGSAFKKLGSCKLQGILLKINFSYFNETTSTISLFSKRNI